MRLVKKALMLILVVAVVGVVLSMMFRKSPTQPGGGQPNMITDISSRASGVSTDTQKWSTDKIREVLAEFNSYLPVFLEAGFTVSEVRVEAGIFPSLIATFTQSKVISAEEQTKILKANENKTVLSYVLTSLFKVYGMPLGKFRLMSVDINISVTPSTTLVLSPRISQICRASLL